MNGSYVTEEGFETACAFPPGVIHEHGYKGCHAATARSAATQAVQSFLTGLTGGTGSQVMLCENTQCRVKLFVTDPKASGRKIQVCPACYGNAGGEGV